MILEMALAALLSCDPRLTALFTPARPVLGSYEVCTTPAALPEAVAATSTLHAAEAENVDAVDAFGAGGPYDRGALNRLYDGRRARVVRAWRDSSGLFESFTFISPYPNAEFTELNSGTLVIRWTVKSGYSTFIATFPFTISIDNTGSPRPSVVSPKWGPNLSLIASGISDVMPPL